MSEPKKQANAARKTYSGPLYILVSFSRDDFTSSEAGVKYFIIGSLSKFEIGKYTLNNAVDGFMRINRYKFDGNGTVSFSSKLSDDTAYIKKSIAI